ncbi:hypothetical protein SRHO_G00196730 [Serrasalmus rhombeus]
MLDHMARTVLASSELRVRKVGCRLGFLKKRLASRNENKEKKGRQPNRCNFRLSSPVSPSALLPTEEGGSQKTPLS